MNQTNAIYDPYLKGSIQDGFQQRKANCNTGQKRGAPVALWLGMKRSELYEI